MAYSQGVPHPPTFSEELLPHKDIGKKDFDNLLEAFKNTQDTNIMVKNHQISSKNYLKN